MMNIFKIECNPRFSFFLSILVLLLIHKISLEEIGFSNIKRFWRFFSVPTFQSETKKKKEEVQHIKKKKVEG